MKHSRNPENLSQINPKLALPPHIISLMMSTNSLQRNNLSTVRVHLCDISYCVNDHNAKSLLPEWHEFGLHPQLLRTLYSQSFSSPTPIQSIALPIAAKGKDVIGVAQTVQILLFCISSPFVSPNYTGFGQNPRLWPSYSSSPSNPSKLPNKVRAIKAKAAITGTNTGPHT